MYLIYPFKTMRITQNYAEGNHQPHGTGNPKDYPLDEAGKDSGRDWFCAPCNVKVARIYGSQSVGYHVWLHSTEKVSLPNGKTEYVTIFAVHFNNDDYVKLKVGQVYKQYGEIFREGTSGNANGNHIHFDSGLGLSTDWQKNSKDVWVLKTSGGTLKPEDAFYVDTSFTKILGSKGIKFKNIPQKAAAVKYQVICTALNIRSQPSVNGKITGALKKGDIINVTEKSGDWGKHSKGFSNVSNKYCKKV